MMLLTETIQKCTTAIMLRRNADDNKAKAESYFNALTKLDQTAKDIEETLLCASEMKTKGIINSSLIPSFNQALLISYSIGVKLRPNSDSDTSNTL